MKKKVSLVLLIISFLLSFSTKWVSANDITGSLQPLDCDLKAIVDDIKYNNSPLQIPKPNNYLQLIFDGAKIPDFLYKNIPSDILKKGSLQFHFLDGAVHRACGLPNATPNNLPSFTQQADISAFKLCDDELFREGKKSVEIIYSYSNIPGFYDYYRVCQPKNYEITSKPNSCSVDVTAGQSGDIDDKSRRVIISNISVSEPMLNFKIVFDNQYIIDKGIVTPQTEVNFHDRVYYPKKDHLVAVYFRKTSNLEEVLCGFTTFEIAEKGSKIEPTNTPAPTPVLSDECKKCLVDKSCENDCIKCPQCTTKSPTKPVSLELCYTIENKYQSACNDCHLGTGLQNEFNSKDRIPGIWTAIGCLPVDFSLLLKYYVFNWGMGFAGGIAFLYLLYGIFLVLTSAGNAEQLEQAKQTIVSALSGLILIIFSVFLLKVIGVDILRLPGFGPAPTPSPTPTGRLPGR